MSVDPVDFIKDYPVADPEDLVTHKDKNTGERRYFYPHESLVSVGYLPEEFGLVRIGDILYELQGHIYRGSESHQGGFWWVDQIIVP